MKFFSRSRRKKTSGRASAYARPRWVDLAQVNAEGDSSNLRIDVDKLTSRGFITRDTMTDVVAREFSLIKRRLFRRLDYFNYAQNGQRKGQDERCPMVLLTSSKPGEGKTFSAANLALSLALEEQIKVLLIDADLAKPSVPDIFGFPEDMPGLFDCLNDPERTVRNDIQRVAGMPLSILPAGQATTSPAPLLSGEAMMKLLDNVSHGKNAFDFVVMDGPPLLATTEAAILAHYADEIMLVVGAGDSTTAQVKSSIEMLGAADKTNLMINLMPLGESLPTEYGYFSRAAAT